MPIIAPQAWLIVDRPGAATRSLSFRHMNVVARDSNAGVLRQLGKATRGQLGGKQRGLGGGKEVGAQRLVGTSTDKPLKHGCKRTSFWLDQKNSSHVHSTEEATAPQRHPATTAQSV